MFGNKKAKYEEQIREVFSEIYEKREQFENRVCQVEEMTTCMQADVRHLMDNANDLVSYAMTNIEEESGLMNQMDAFSKELKTAVDDYRLLCQALEKQMEDSTTLVEDNKHYTSPAKYLTETPNVLRETYEGLDSHISEMGDFGKRIGVLALNAAIEAGRMGDVGKQFVAASEEIRQTSIVYEKSVLSMKEELDNARNKVAELEDTIHHMVSLLKESNMGTARLMKKAVEIHKMAEQTAMRDFSDDMILLRDKVVGVRNLEEEIAKLGERNRLQLTDMQEDVLSQKKEIVEIESDISHLLDIAKEQLQ